MSQQEDTPLFCSQSQSGGFSALPTQPPRARGRCAHRRKAAPPPPEGRGALQTGRHRRQRRARAHFRLTRAHFRLTRTHFRLTRAHFRLTRTHFRLTRAHSRNRPMKKHWHLGRMAPPWGSLVTRRRGRPAAAAAAVAHPGTALADGPTPTGGPHSCGCSCLTGLVVRRPHGH